MQYTEESGNGSPLRTLCRLTSFGQFGRCRSFLARGTFANQMLGELSRLCQPLTPDVPQPILSFTALQDVCVGADTTVSLDAFIVGKLCTLTSDLVHDIPIQFFHLCRNTVPATVRKSVLPPRFTHSARESIVVRQAVNRRAKRFW